MARLRMRELSLETQSFVPPFLGRQMTSCLYSPFPTPKRLREIGQTPAEDQKALGTDREDNPEGFQAQAAVAGQAMGGSSGDRRGTGPAVSLRNMR